MSRLIRVFVESVLFSPSAVGPEPGYAPLFKTHSIRNQRNVIGVFPDGGELCYFLEFQPGNGEVVTGLPEHTKINGIPFWTSQNVNLWIKVIYQDMIGWMDMEHVQSIFELDLDENGDMVEKQVYPYPKED